MPLFGPPDIEKMKAKRDFKGLAKALNYENNYEIRVKAAGALGELGDTQAVEPLISELRGRSEVRDAAKGALVKIGTPALEMLIPLLKDWNVREDAADVLGKIGDPRAVEPLIISIRDELGCARPNQVHAKEINTIVTALVKIGIPAVEPLSVALRDEKVGEYAATALGQLKDPRAIEPLIAALYDQKLGGYAFKALGQLDDTRAVEPLLGALKSDSPDVRYWAAKVLEQLHWQPEVNETGVPYFIALDKWDMVVQIGDLAVNPLIVLLQESDPYIRNRAVAALVSIGASTIEPLVAALNYENSLLANQNDQDNIDHWARTFTIIEILGKIIDPRTIEPLIAFLNNQKLNKPAADVFERFGDTRVAESITALLTSRNEDIRTIADNNGLGVVAIKQLNQLIYNRDKFVFYDAIVALGKIGSDEAINLLIDALKNADIEKQRLIIWVLEKKLNDSNVVKKISDLLIFACDSNTDLYQELYKLLKAAGVKAILYLIQLLDSLEGQYQNNRLSHAYLYSQNVKSILSELTGREHSTSREWKNWYDSTKGKEL